MADSPELAEVQAQFHSPTRRQSLGLVDRTMADFEHFNQLTHVNARHETHREVRSHELRSHIDHILRMTTVLRSRQLEEQDRQCVEVIRRSSFAVIGLIDERAASAHPAGE